MITLNDDGTAVILSRSLLLISRHERFLFITRSRMILSLRIAVSLRLANHPKLL